jgi:hypothetical protein
MPDSDLLDRKQDEDAEDFPEESSVKSPNLAGHMTNFRVKKN